jgi:hypothetical protein
MTALKGIMGKPHPADPITDGNPKALFFLHRSIAYHVLAYLDKITGVVGQKPSFVFPINTQH